MINIYIRKRENNNKKKINIIGHTRQTLQSFRVLNIFGLQSSMPVPPMKAGLVSMAYCQENHAIVVACDLINGWRGISPKP